MKTKRSNQARDCQLPLALLMLVSMSLMAALPIPGDPTGDWIVNPDNGHIYNLVVSESISWPDANASALAMSLPIRQIQSLTRKPVTLSVV